MKTTKWFTRLAAIVPALLSVTITGGALHNILVSETVLLPGAQLILLFSLVALVLTVLLLTAVWKQKTGAQHILRDLYFYVAIILLADLFLVANDPYYRFTITKLVWPVLLISVAIGLWWTSKQTNAA